MLSDYKPPAQNSAYLSYNSTYYKLQNSIDLVPWSAFETVIIDHHELIYSIMSKLLNSSKMLIILVTTTWASEER